MVVLLSVCVPPSLRGQEARSYSVCLAAPPADNSPGPLAPGMNCMNRDLSIQIGTQTRRPWPAGNTRVDNVLLQKGDRITVFCKGRPQQSFRFSTKWLQTTDLLIHLDGYRLVQLFDAKDKPWYKCGAKSPKAEAGA